MASLEIHPLSGLRDEAAKLLAERYARQRAAEPLLPDERDFEQHLPAEGSVATVGGRAVAFLGAEVDGDTARAGFGGAAATDGEAMRDLFAAEAERWGTQRFVIPVPASDDVLRDALFRLAFGCQFIWGVRETEAAELVDFGGVIRPSTRADVDSAVDLEEELWTLQLDVPSFSGATLPSHEEAVAEWGEVWDEPDMHAHFVAERDGRVAGHLLLWKRPEGGLRVPASNIDLALAVTTADARGSGVGRALTAHAMRWAHDNGYHSMTVDWRSVNLLSSRFWPRRGFRPQYLRLYRAVP
jgi:GNAT superfamily N-acetyltransferase